MISAAPLLILLAPPPGKRAEIERTNDEGKWKTAPLSETGQSKANWEMKDGRAGGRGIHTR